MAAQVFQFSECLFVGLTRQFGITAGFFRLSQHEVRLIRCGRIDVRQARKCRAAITPCLFGISSPQFNGRKQQFAQRRF